MLGAPIYFRYEHALNGYATRLPPAALAAIQADNRVLFVSEDREMFVDGVCTPQDFSPSVQCIPTGIDRIDGDLSSTKSGNGRGSVNINVAVLDTGIDVDHPDLAVAGGVNCSSDKTFAGIMGALNNSIGVVGVAPGARLWAAKLARRDGQRFESAIWLHRAREMPTEDFKREVEKELSGKEEEPWEIIYFKVYKSQIPVIEQAIDTAALMLGTDKSRGYCLEMICADFLAGANLDNGNPDLLLNSISQFFKFLPGEQKHAFLQRVNEEIES